MLSYYSQLSSSLSPDGLEPYLAEVKDQPVIINENASFQFKVQPPIITPENVLSIRLPAFSTALPPAEDLKIMMAERSAVVEAVGQKKSVDVSWLDEIDVEKISGGRTKKTGPEVYSLTELKRIARNLEIPAPNSKPELANSIMAKLKQLGRI